MLNNVSIFSPDESSGYMYPEVKQVFSIWDLSMSGFYYFIKRGLVFQEILECKES